MDAGFVGWGKFILGGMLGLSISLPSNYFLEFFRFFIACESYKSSLISGALFFFYHMSNYIDNGFTGNVTRVLMIWQFLNFGSALRGSRGTCGTDDHGFSDDFVDETLQL